MRNYNIIKTLACKDNTEGYTKEEIDEDVEEDIVRQDDVSNMFHILANIDDK